MSYAIGVAQPLSVHVDSYGTGSIPDKEILAKVLDKFDFRPGAARLLTSATWFVKRTWVFNLQQNMQCLAAKPHSTENRSYCQFIRGHDL